MKGKIKILLIDDELEFHHIIKHAFPEVELFSAYSVEGGSWLLTQPKEEFDLILLDLNLGNRSSKFQGLELISKKTFTPIIMVSSYIDNATKFEAQKRGASAFLSKGNFDINSWLKVLQLVLIKDGTGEPKVFISYVDEDDFFVKYISDKLIENKINVRVGDIPSKNLPAATIIEGLTDADFVIAILSPEAIQSDWVKLGINQSVELEAEKRIVDTIPVLVKQCDIPDALKSKRVISFIDNTKFDICLKALVDAVKKAS